MNRPTILVIDDDVVTLKILTAVLNEQGFQVRVASDPETGVHLAESVRPDLVILDIDLPGINGLQVLWEFRHSSVTKSTPVLMLTGESKTKSAGLAFDLGADGYFTKPFNHQEIKQKIDELIANAA